LKNIDSITLVTARREPDPINTERAESAVAPVATPSGPAAVVASIEAPIRVPFGRSAVAAVVLADDSADDSVDASVDASVVAPTATPTAEQGFILHARPFQERGQILDLLTIPSGRVAVLARRRSTGLRPFTLLDLAWRGRGELPTLSLGEEKQHFPLSGRALVCGLYLNELVLRLLPRGVPVPTGISILATAYTRLGQEAAPEPALRRAEWDILRLLDSGLEYLAEQIDDPAAHYRYHPETGLSGPLAPGTAGTLPGTVLLALANGQPVDDNVRRPARDFMRGLIDQHLAGRTLHTRQLL